MDSLLATGAAMEARLRLGSWDESRRDVTWRRGWKLVDLWWGGWAAPEGLHASTWAYTLRICKGYMRAAVSLVCLWPMVASAH